MHASGSAGSPLIITSKRMRSFFRYSENEYSIEAYPLLRDLSSSKKSVTTSPSGMSYFRHVRSSERYVMSMNSPRRWLESSMSVPT